MGRILEDMDEYLEGVYDEMDSCFNLWVVSYKIGDVDTVDGEELVAIQELYESKFGCKVKAAKEVAVEITERTDLYEDVTDVTIYVIKVGNKWFVDITESDQVITALERLFYAN